MLTPMPLNELDSSRRTALFSTARQLYAQAPLKARALQPLRTLICPFEELLSWIPESGRVLDVGCGAGLLLGLIGSLRPSVDGVGFDADLSSIAAAKSMAATNFPEGRIRFERRAVEEQWPDGPFDVVALIDVLHHLPRSRQRAAIDKAFARVTPGGLLIYKDMANRPFLHAWWNRLHDLVLARQWIHYRRITEVVSWLCEANSEILARSTTHIGPYAHEMIVAKRPR